MDRQQQLTHTGWPREDYAAAITVITPTNAKIVDAISVSETGSTEVSTASVHARPPHAWLLRRHAAVVSRRP